MRDDIWIAFEIQRKWPKIDTCSYFLTDFFDFLHFFFRFFLLFCIFSLKFSEILSRSVYGCSKINWVLEIPEENQHLILFSQSIFLKLFCIFNELVLNSCLEEFKHVLASWIFSDLVWRLFRKFALVKFEWKLSAIDGDRHEAQTPVLDSLQEGSQTWCESFFLS